MKLRLYEIQNEYLQLAETLIANGGEVSEEILIALQMNQENLETKAVNYGFICKQLDAESKIIEGEIERLEGLKKSRGKTAQKLKDTLSVAMQMYGVDKIETPIMKINFRKSQTTEIDNMALIPKEFIVTKETSSPDKKAIKEALENGIEVLGAHIQENFNLQIK